MPYIKIVKCGNTGKGLYIRNNRMETILTVSNFDQEQVKMFLREIEVNPRVDIKLEINHGCYLIYNTPYGDEWKITISTVGLYDGEVINEPHIIEYLKYIESRC